MMTTQTGLSARARGIQESPTLALVSKAKALKAKGRPIISFAAGEPDFSSPKPVLDAAHAAIDAGFTKYAPAAGYPELRAAVAEELRQISGMQRGADEVIVSDGAKHVLYNLIQALIDPGERVAFAAPYWVSYPSMVDLAGGESVIIPTRAAEGFRLSPEALDAALAEAPVKLVILNSPQNPTGVVYEPADVDALVDVALARGAYVISDEIYAHLVFGDRPHRSALAIDTPERRERVIWVGGVSKSYAMTGWRIGYAVGPKEVIAAATRIQSHSTSGPCSVSQQAALGALKAGVECAAPMMAAFDARLTAMVEGLERIPHLTFARPGGTFYAYPDASHYCQGRIGERRIANDMDLAEALLEEADIAVVPGSAFGTPGCLRLSFALGMEDLLEGLLRLQNALAKWSAD